MSPSRLRTFVLAGAASFCMLASAAQAEPYATDSPQWGAAMAAGVAHWGSLPCGGVVEYHWTELAEGVLGYASWTQPAEPPADPARFSNCRIDLAPSVASDPERFCTVLAHELGHLHGHAHVTDPADLMAPEFSGVLPECARAMAAFVPEATPVARPAASVARVRPARAHRGKRRAHRRAQVGRP